MGRPAIVLVEVGVQDLERLQRMHIALADRRQKMVDVVQRERAATRARSSSSGRGNRRRLISRSRISRPSLVDVACSSCFSHCRILCRARPVRTWASQSRLGRARRRGEDLDRLGVLQRTR